MARRLLDLSDPRIETLEDVQDVAFGIVELVSIQEEANALAARLRALKSTRGIDLDPGYLEDAAYEMGWAIQGLVRARDRYCEAEAAE